FSCSDIRPAIRSAEPRHGQWPRRAASVKQRKTDIKNRIKQLKTAPDIPSRSYGAIMKHFEKLAAEQSWLNENGAVYPVSLSNLQRYIAYYESRVKPQSILSYLAAIK